MAVVASPEPACMARGRVDDPRTLGALRRCHESGTLQFVPDEARAIGPVSRLADEHIGHHEKQPRGSAVESLGRQVRDRPWRRRCARRVSGRKARVDGDPNRKSGGTGS